MTSLEDLEYIVSQWRVHTVDLSAEDLLKAALDRFGSKIALATSFGAEDQVLTDMLCSMNAVCRLFTLDTGRLAQETYDLMAETRKRYGIEIDLVFPDADQVQAMVTLHGPNLFYDSIELRKQCCFVRKIGPLKKKLTELDAWICGLRAQQSFTRAALVRVDVDRSFGLVKICPLADWSVERVWEYIRVHNVPYNVLHDKGYPSIGCAPCTRALKTNEDIRSGRWWWEQDLHKECGLHGR